MNKNRFAHVILVPILVISSIIAVYMTSVDSNGKTTSGDQDVVEYVPLQTEIANRIRPRQVGSGSTRGTQTVGYGKTKIDGSNNRITVANDAGNGVIVGDISDSDSSFGISVSDSNGVPRLLAGEYPDGNIKIKLSQPTYDVSTATDDQLIWSSDFNMFKIVESGVVTITVPDPMIADQVASTTITHDLGYKPAFLAYITGGTAYGTSPDQVLMMPFSSRYVTGGVFRGFFYTDAYSTDTTFVVRHTNNTIVTDTTGGTVEIKYYLLRETAN